MIQDAAIIGNGPAGLSAALYLLRAGFSVTVIGQDNGALEKAGYIENYFGLGTPKTGHQLVEDGKAQVLRLGGQLLRDQVVGITWDGDFLVDTWHQGETGNMWELGEREMAPGYDSGQLRQGILNGDSRYVVFVSRTIGEYLYFYYTPLGINQWRVAVSVPESVVFESAHAIQRLLNLFLAFEMICFVIYFLWMIRYARRVTAEKQRRLDTVRYIYDVEKLLFNAHEKKENIGRALEKNRRCSFGGTGELLDFGTVF